MSNRKIKINIFWFTAAILFSIVNYATAAYQFTPTSGALIQGSEMPIRSELGAVTAGVNVGSWKGTLADDGFHWRASSTASGINMQLVFDNFQLNGANKLIVETDIAQVTGPNLLLEICDFATTTLVTHAADAQCTGGGWRAVNSRTVANLPTFYTDNAGDALAWSVYDGYWSTYSTSGTAIATPLSNFVNNNQMRMRFFATSTTGSLSVDFLRVNAVVDPIYSAKRFNKYSGGTVTGFYPNTNVFGNTGTGIITNTGDNVLLSVPGTAATTSDFYLAFGNVKTYQGLNTLLVATEAYCSAATQGLQYKFAVRNFTGETWEDISEPIDCLAAGVNNYFSKNSATIGDYISSSSEIWIRDYALSTSTTSLVIDSMYLTLGTVATSTEVSFGTSTAGRLVINPSVTDDRPNALITDSTYMYVGGFDTNGGDRRWRLEKRNLNDGALVTAFASSGVAVSDLSITHDEITALATTSDAIFSAGYATTTNSVWYIEKRDITTGALVSGFGLNGATSSNPSANADKVYGLNADSDYLYIVGTDFTSSTSNSAWRIEKRTTSTGALVTAFDTDGIIQSNPGTGLDIPYAVKVVGNDLYIAGSASSSAMLNMGWRVEKRNATTGALLTAFDTDGIVESNPTTSFDELLGMAVDANAIYLVGYSSSTAVGGATGRARIEKRATSTGALVTAFSGDGILEMDYTRPTGEIWQAVSIDSSSVYLSGVDTLTAATIGSLRIDKFDITTGATTTAFDADGNVRAEEGAEDRFLASSINNGSLFLAGYGSSTPSGNKWVIEKRDTTTGLLSTSTPTFGKSYPTSTWNVNTSGDTNSWNLLSRDESANMGTGSDYYPLNTDGDAVIEEAAAANFTFGVTVPSGAAVTSLYYATRFLAASSTMQVGIRDYSGLTGTLGGWTAWGAAQNIAMGYQDAVTIGGIAASGLHGFTTNPEDYIDTVNNRMNMNIRTTIDAPTSTNFSPNIDFMMATFQWTEDSSHVSETYQFTPTSGALIQGSEMPIRSELGAVTAGVNVGSWKGTLADDGFHWRASSTASGINMQLVFDNFQLNGANKLLVETDIAQVTGPNLLLEICDFVATTSVYHAADAQCTGGGWRALNTPAVNNAPTFYTDNAGDALAWALYDGYWSTYSTSGTAIATPLTNFVNNGQMRMRFFSTSTTGSLSVDFLRVNAVVDPIYSAKRFNKYSGGTVTGFYPNTNVFGNTGTAIIANAGDNVLLSVPGTAATTSDFYLAFGNVKTYQGLNTILVATEAYCSAATQGLQYKFAVRNFTGETWEDISEPIDCLAAGVNNYFSKNSTTIGDYISSSSEIWIRDYALSTSTTSLVIDSMYLTLGTVASTTEVSFGTSTAGRLVINPSVTDDRPNALITDSTYMYVGGFDTNGGDRRWRLEKRNLSDGALVTAFASSGVAVSDLSITHDEITALATTSDAIFSAGYATTTNSVWYIEKRDITTGALVTGFGLNGATSSNPSANADKVYGLNADSDYLYIVGADYSSSTTNSAWRIEKRTTSTGALVTAFDTDGIIQSNPGTGLDIPYAVKVSGNDLYIAGSASSSAMLNMGWRVEKRNATTGALLTAFDTDGIVESNPTASFDELLGMAVDANAIYLVGYSSSTAVGGATGRARIEKRATSTGALVTAFSGDGILEMDYTRPTGEIWQAVSIDSSSVYLSGVDTLTAATIGTFRIDKFDITTGATTTAFDADGNVRAEEGAEDRFLASSINNGSLFLAGYGSSTPSGNKWVIEKRDTTTGLLSTSTPTFGKSYPTSTWNVNTSGDTNSWNLLSRDESANMGTGSDYYPLNTDGDAVIEEAASANFTFGVTVPSGAAVTSLYYAARFLAASSTMQVGIRDYSGLTGTLGGWTAWGAAQNIAMGYQDAVIIGGIAASGLHGFTTNPEDYIDTVNNRMNMNIRTTIDAPTSTNFSPNIDFMMATFQWTGTTSYVPPVSGAKTLTLGDHIAGQRTNQFDTETSSLTSSTLFRYKLTSSGGSISITSTTVTIASQGGFVSADITSAKLYLDSNSDGAVDAGDSQLGSNGTTTITGESGSISFGNGWSVTATSQILLQLNVANIDSGDYLTLLLYIENIVTSDSKTGSVTGVNHARPLRYYGGGGSDGFEGGPPVTGTLTGGGSDGGDSGDPGGGTVGGGGSDGGGGEAP